MKRFILLIAVLISIAALAKEKPPVEIFLKDGSSKTVEYITNYHFKKYLLVKNEEGKKEKIFHQDISYLKKEDGSIHKIYDCPMPGYSAKKYPSLVIEPVLCSGEYTLGREDRGYFAGYVESFTGPTYRESKAIKYYLLKNDQYVDLVMMTAAMQYLTTHFPNCQFTQKFSDFYGDTPVVMPSDPMSRENPAYNIEVDVQITDDEQCKCVIE